jgi:hypothetical protein
MSPCEQLEITDHYSGGELDGALAAARQARSYRAARELAPGPRAAGSHCGALHSRRDFAQPALGAEGFPPDLDDRLTSKPAVPCAQIAVIHDGVANGAKDPARTVAMAQRENFS